MEIQLVSGQQNLSKDFALHLQETQALFLEVIQAQEFVAPIQQVLVQVQEQGLLQPVQVQLDQVV